MSIFSHIRLIYSCYFSKPSFNRPIYQAIRRGHAQKIVEIGIGTGQRAIRMIEVARLVSPQAALQYVGIDRFEDGVDADGSRLTLKAAHQLLRREGTRVQLVPGNPSDSLARIANSLGKIDLLIVPAEFDTPSCARAWFFVPRMLHEGSAVLVERPTDEGQKLLQVKPRHEIEALASASVRRHAE